MAERVASCSCGLLRVTCRSEPRLVSLCHCLQCQRQTGSTYGVAAFFLKQDVVISGASGLFTRQSDTGFAVEQHFCPNCGSTVFWFPSRKPDMVAVAVGAFADPGFPAPGQSVHREARHHWINF